ncbi:hypothetical protein [Erythrobacter sp. AP23]|uniref:hypothetical protein n=1 Tax=Erythrobacter sp. AP23 TaxID=499656 RepID=UPI000A71E2CF|nr:hypothetical protein [Erythrobacter sp. AP23]
MSASASAQDYPFEEWAGLWQRTCGSLDTAYSVIDDPDAHGWRNADADTDEPAARIIETAIMSAEASAEDATLTGLYVLRQSARGERALAAFQEMQFVDEPYSYLLACTVYDTNAPAMSIDELARLSSERPITDISANGLNVIEWPGGADGSGRIKMTAGSIPQDHPGAALLQSGLVLKTQYVFSETSE